MVDDKKNYIDIIGIHKYYGRKHVLDDINFHIKPGDIYGILGPSGCGKTTIVKIIAGILDSNEGETFVLNKKMPNLKIMKDIGYMAQSDALYEGLTAEENLLFFGSLYGMNKKKIRKRTAELMALLNLSFEGNKKVSSYSGGMKRRLSLAIALLNSPKILILDEPTVGIDPLLRRSIWEEFRKIASENTAILLTTHVMDEATKCDKLVMIRDGKIIASGTPNEIILQSGKDSIEEAFIHFSFGGVNNED